MHALYKFTFYLHTYSEHMNRQWHSIDGATMCWTWTLQ